MYLKEWALGRPRKNTHRERTIKLISHGKEIKVFAGNSNPKLAQGICDKLNIELGKSVATAFSDGEISISINEPVRGADVFIIQSTCGPVNNNLMEMLIMIDAMRRASAGRITAVMPYFGYGRQDRKAKSRDPISAKLVANLITEAGADRVLTMDLHASQIQGFFDIPVDNLMGGPIFATYFKEKVGLAVRTQSSSLPCRQRCQSRVLPSWVSTRHRRISAAKRQTAPRS